MTVREIQAHLTDMYGTEVSPTLISTVTDAVIEDVKAWQARPLDALYPVVYLDCIRVKVRVSGSIWGSQHFWLAVENKKAALMDGFLAAFKNNLKRL